MSTEAKTLVATLEETAGRPLRDVPAEDIDRIMRRVAPPEKSDTTIDVAAFNSAI